MFKYLITQKVFILVEEARPSMDGPDPPLAPNRTLPAPPGSIQKGYKDKRHKGAYSHCGQPRSSGWGGRISSSTCCATIGGWWQVRGGKEKLEGVIREA